MNEQIKQLAEQAGLQPFEDCGPGYVYKMEKFAELMVKKFDDILLLQQLDSIGNNDKKSAELIEKIRDKTKTYFGVEE